jgi:hypothetical protein
MRNVMLLLCVALLASCGMTKEKLGMAKQAPDERLVEQRRPLSLPPRFDERPVVVDNTRNPVNE